ncbi:MAG: cbb3-type cytochrome c oxidase subunit I [Deltaproteobacteria bacterium]|nr:cbb3-type cytochrome c oxidase subunit I [Deltaproteobacteria bacterium]
MDPTLAPSTSELSPWWRRGVALILVVGFTVLGWVSAQSYKVAPPIPERALGPGGVTVFTGEEVLDGQEVFLRRGLMENGTIWGHGAYLGPDFSAEYLHRLQIDTTEWVARQRFAKGSNVLTAEEREAVGAEVQRVLKENRYDPNARTLALTQAEASSFEDQIGRWQAYFATPTVSRGLPARYVTDPREVRSLTAFFAWTAWASVANRPGQPFSYTNNFPYDPRVGNTPSAGTYLWSALSLIALLGGTALVLVAFGRFDYLGWKNQPASPHVHPEFLPGRATPIQRATLKYFLAVALLFLVQVLVGGAVAHYRADPGTFYGIDLSALLPSQLLRTWHLQLALFWIATAYVAGGLFLSSTWGTEEPRGQVPAMNVLFTALVVVVGGSLLGEAAGVRGLLGSAWFWLGHQGWEYLDLGRLWQLALAAGLLFWLFLLYRATRPGLADPEQRELARLFLAAALTIPLFYLPAFLFGSRTHFTIVDNWRFWIIHLWVEGFFELFATVMVAVLFYKLGLVTRLTATRVVYLDAILFLGGGIVGTGHHWYWTGQSQAALALSAVFSALEVVPLTLLTLDAWDFISLTRGRCDECGQNVSLPHRWTFYFLMAVGFWNFVGAGVFGFLINLPIVSYFEVGTMLTPNHGHAALMGAFGMLALALLVFALRQAASEELWQRTEGYVRVSFWGLNVGLALMVVTSLFPGGVLQLLDVLRNGYWHGRGAEFANQGLARTIEWLRMPADLVFIVLGAVPLSIATWRVYWGARRPT